ncbi:synaptotagmin beta isoform X3 [Megalopta genalis]|uniref:synaptotagmin beta isoform X3 n=1 Tax=Megalopta genalis TaxID=115081 RepID=UPI003FD04D6C
MVTSAIFGAAAGTGLALVVAVTIVVYRYYSVKRKGTYWSNLDRWPDPPATRRPEPRQEDPLQQSHAATSSHVLNCWNKQQKNYCAVQSGEFNVAKEKRAVQPCSSVVVESGSLPHQSRSYPSGSSGSGGSSGRLYTRTSSVSSQSSLEGQPGHRSSSHTRSFGPDGRHHHHREPLHTASSYPPSRSSSEGGPQPPASPLGSIQPDLYLPRNGPIFLKSLGNGKSLGRLHLRFKYDFNRSDLHVHLIEAHNLAGTDQGGFNEPYVKLTLTPVVDSRKRETQIYRNEANPFFDQQFKFPVSHDEFHDKTLVLQVLDYDRFSRNDIVGSVKVPLNILRLDSPSSTEEVWGQIERERKPPEQIQEVLLSLSYLPSAERLKVVIVEARNLFPPQEKETLNSFVKVNLLCAEKRMKKKTTVKKATTSPMWNEAMSFDIPSSSLASSAIEVRVMDSSNEFIGGNAIVGSCIIGPATGAIPGVENSGSQGREHWLHMTQSPRETIQMWHTLH